MQPSRPRLVLVVLTAMFATVLATQAPASGQDVPTCNGLEATIIGTEGRDNLRGTPGDDVIVGLGGPDRIVGLGGNDTICGGEGRDRIRGNNGKDTIFGEGGRDRIHGGGGADTIRGMGGNDRLDGGNGDDWIRGNRGNDFLVGGPGSDDCVDADANIDRCQLEANGRVTMMRANWSSGYIQAEITTELLREMGYTVSPPDRNEYAPDLGFQFLASGEGDIYVNGWFPGHQMWFEASLPNGDRVGDNITIARPTDSAVQDGGLQGFVVTKAWADREGFTTLDEINDTPRLWQALDSDGDGKGEIYGCSESWTCDDIINSNIEFAGWDNLEQIRAGYDAMFAEFITKARAGLPAVAYTWTPTSYLATANPGVTTMWLSMEDASVLDESNPLGQEGGEEYSQREGDQIGHRDVTAGTCLVGPDGCQLGWLGAVLSPSYNNEFGDTNPAAVQLLEVAEFSAFDLSVLTEEFFDAGGRQSDVRALAQQWINENRELADAWIRAALATD